MNRVEEFQFQAGASQVLNLVINSLCAEQELEQKEEEASGWLNLLQKSLDEHVRQARLSKP